MIYLIRHGEASAGWGDALDPGLSELGNQQAEATASKLKNYGACPALKSPMARCRETALAFEQLKGVDALVNPAISEIETPKNLKDRSQWLRGLMSGNWDDSNYDFSRWRANALKAIAELPDNSAVFTHFIAINAIVGMIEKDPRVIVFRPGHCSITKLNKRVDGTLEVFELGSEAATEVL